MTDALQVIRWGVKWRDKSQEHIMYENCLPVIFRTRKEARAWIDLKFGYIRTRKDLRIAPHFWKIPTAIRVRIEAVNER